MKKMNEQEMKSYVTDLIQAKNLGSKSKLADTFFANKLMSSGVYDVADAIIKESTAKKRGPKMKILSHLTDIMGEDFLENYDEVISFSLSLVELVLSKLYIDQGNVSFRITTAVKIVEVLFKGDTANNEHVQMAVKLFETVIESLPFVSVEYDYRRKDKTIIYSLSEEANREMKNVISKLVDVGYYAMPMTDKPVEWQIIGNKVVGGYKTLRTSIIRSNKINMPKEMFDPSFLYDSEPLRALNILQAVPYRINKNNLERLLRDTQRPVEPIKPDGFKQWGKDWKEYTTDMAVFKSFGGLEPDKPVISEEDKVLFVTYMSDKKMWVRETGKFNTNMLAIEIAESLVDEEAIYFPQNFDYRGRMYPVPIGLSPQGNDVAKGLLEFADSVQLTPEGVQQCIAFLASSYGYDKKKWIERFELGEELLATGNDKTYLEADEPYIFAQHWDLLKRVERGDYTSRAPIFIDGTINGLQHISALTLDKFGGEKVNVSGNEERQDLYQMVADDTAKELDKDLIVAESALEEIDNGEFVYLKESIKNIIGEYKNIDELESILEEKIILFHRLVSAMGGDKGRKVSKRPVMTGPYGATYNGYKKFILESLTEHFPILGNHSTAGLLASYMNDVIKKNGEGRDRYKKWISEVYKKVAKKSTGHEDCSVYFTTPDGFIVRNLMYEVKSKLYEVNSLVNRNNTAKKIKLQRVTDKVNVRKIGTAIQPNIIHALDASHLRMTALEMHDSGVNQLWCIHDSFATNPNNIVLLGEITREQFIKLYTPGHNHPLELIYRDVENQTGKPCKRLEQFTGDEMMDIESVRKNEHFFS